MIKLIKQIVYRYLLRNDLKRTQKRVVENYAALIDAYVELKNLGYSLRTDFTKEERQTLTSILDTLEPILEEYSNFCDKFNKK